MATSITIRDEATRRAVEYALWGCAAGLNDGDEFFYELWHAAEQVAGSLLIEDGEEAACDRADRRLRTLTDLRADVDRVREADLGTELRLSIETDDLRKYLDYCRDDIEGEGSDGEFFAQEPKVRDLMLATRDAAVRFAAELAEREAVVA